MLGRGSWLSATPTALVPGWHSVWNTETLRGSGEHPQEVVWLRSECTWSTNSSSHSCAGTTPACSFQITNPGSTAETQPQSPLLPAASLGAWLSGSSGFPELQIKPSRVTECTEYLLILGHLQTEQSRRLESSF